MAINAGRQILRNSVRAAGEELASFASVRAVAVNADGDPIVILPIFVRHSGEISRKI
jgi:hypothetical protein